MANYIYILKKGMDICPGGSDGEQWVPEDKKLGKELPVEQRVPALTESVTSAVLGTPAGLFERHKLIMATHHQRESFGSSNDARDADWPPPSLRIVLVDLHLHVVLRHHLIDRLAVLELGSPAE